VSKNLEVIKPKTEEVRESFSSMIECIFWSIYFFSLDLNTFFLEICLNLSNLTVGIPTPVIIPLAW